MNRRAVVAGLLCSGPVAASPSAAVGTFRALDGVPITARLYGQGPHAILLVPGAHGVGETWHFECLKLAQAGLRVVAMDYRGLGSSSDAPQDASKAHLDVLGAVTQLRSDGYSSVSVVGASWGGWAAGTAAVASPGSIDRIVLLAHSAFERPEKLGGRKLFIVGNQDRDGSGKLRLASVRDQFNRTSEPKRLTIFESAAHAQFLFLTEHAARVRDEVQAFLTAP